MEFVKNKMEKIFLLVKFINFFFYFYLLNPYEFYMLLRVSKYYYIYNFFNVI